MAKPKLTFKIEGSKELQRKFNAIATKKSKETKEHINKTAINIQKGAKKRTRRVDNGDMRAGWVIEPYHSGFSVDVMNRVEYAVYHEYGTGIYAQHPKIPGRKTPWVYRDPKTKELVFTRGITPMPMLRPSFDENKKDFEKGIERIYKDL